MTREEVEERLGTTGGFAIPLRPGRRSGLIWVVLLVVIAALALVGGLPGGGEGVNLREVLKPFPAAPAADGRTLGSPDSPGFVARVSRDVQQTWRQLFRQAGVAYRPARLVVFDRGLNTDCGLLAPAASDAFYCQFGAQLFLDSGLSDTYLVAHGYAHHVQELLGITDHVARAEEASPRQARDLWRAHELQADCLAGVWAHSALRKVDAAAAIQLATIPLGPDHSVNRESWAGASREQRASWFQRGFRDGVPAACDSFSAVIR